MNDLLVVIGTVAMMAGFVRGFLPLLIFAALHRLLLSSWLSAPGGGSAADALLAGLAVLALIEVMLAKIGPLMRGLYLPLFVLRLLAAALVATWSLMLHYPFGHALLLSVTFCVPVAIFFNLLVLPLNLLPFMTVPISLATDFWSALIVVLAATLPGAAVVAATVAGTTLFWVNTLLLKAARNTLQSAVRGTLQEVRRLNQRSKAA